MIKTQNADKKFGLGQIISKPQYTKYTSCSKSFILPKFVADMPQEYFYALLLSCLCGVYAFTSTF